ncbi:MAG: PD-(D/E)XK nuclease family protein, partial [Sphaerochaetaceae bacterium]|nr:PD-(D/E)XK nuclease family protein [Sphaerochaetaceae bacterium]
SLDNRKSLEPVVLHESVSGVQFMSIHKSKGLAFPIVIVYGMSDSTQGDKDENVFKIGEDICAVCNKKFFSAVYEQRSRKKEEFAESKRLLYVAMTRPRFHMVLIGPQIEGDTIKDIIALPGTFKKNKDKHFCVSLDRSSLGKNVAIDLQPWLEETLGKVNRITEIEVPVIGCENPSSVVFKKTHVGVTSLVEDSFGKSYDSLGDGRYNSLDNTLKKTGIKSTAFGELAHKALEFLVKKDMTSFENLKASFSGTDEKTLSFITNEAKAMALDFGDSVFYKSYIEGTPIENLQEELRFHTPKSSLGSLESKIDSSYEQNISVEGVIDLLVEKPTYNLIVDYKTDHYRNPEAHKDQLLVYEKTIKALYPNKRVYGVLYYLRDNKNQDVIFWDEEGREYSKIDG